MGFFNLEHFEENVKLIVDKFNQNDNFLKDKWKEIQRLNYEIDILRKEDINILSELKNYSIFSKDFLDNFSELCNKKSLSPNQKKEYQDFADFIITTFFSEIGLDSEDVKEIKIHSCSLTASDVGPCSYYIKFIVPCFSSKDKIIVSIPLYNISLQAIESYCYKIGTDNGDTVNFVGHSVYLSEILGVLERTFLPITAPKASAMGDMDGDHIE